MFPRAERAFRDVKRRRLLLLLGVVTLAATSAFALAAYYVTCPFQGWQQPAVVDVRPGTSSRAIAARLRTTGVLRDEWSFLLLHYLLPGQTLKAGEYYFDRALSPWEVLRKLRRGDVRQHSMTIPEGYNIFEVAEAVSASGLVSRDQIREVLQDTALIDDLDPSAASLEGYLFPDTYYFTRHTSAPRWWRGWWRGSARCTGSWRVSTLPAARCGRSSSWLQWWRRKRRCLRSASWWPASFTTA